MPMTQLATELTACDIEQIHLIGAVQSLGAIIVADISSGEVTHISGNLAEQLGKPPGDLIGMQLDSLIRPEDVQALFENAVRRPGHQLGEAGSLKMKASAFGGKELDHLSYVHRDSLVIEIFWKFGAGSEERGSPALRQDVINDFRVHRRLDDFCKAALELIRSQTGYDRVMCYRFHPDGHGEVIAENTELEEKFIGLHYPASDIPEPARRQFSLNRLRLIGDVASPTVPIYGGAGQAHDLDLSYSKLRAVSPVHLKYLENMGVAATLVMPLMVESKLWGLLVCHHQTPRSLSPQDIHTTELFSEVIELFVENIERMSRDKSIIEAQARAFALSQPEQSGLDFSTVAKQLAEWFDADAVVARVDGRWLPLWNWSGQTVDFGSLHSFCVDGFFATDCLSIYLELPETDAKAAAGAAFLSIDADRNEYFVLLRKDFQETVTWAGSPMKPVGHDDQGLPILEPRGSFARWSELIDGRSRPFSENETLALGIIVQSLRAFIASRRAASLDAAKRELETVQLELRNQILNTARSASLGELAAAIAHELNQPLTAISNFVSASRVLMAKNDPDQKKIAELMDNAVHEAQRAGQIVHHLRNLMRPGVERKTTFDFRAMLKQSVKLAITSSANGGADLELDIPADMPALYGDKVQIEQMVFNLVRNAVEAMDAQPVRKLKVTARVQDGTMVTVLIDDTGPGIAPDYLETLFKPFRTSKPEGMGIGLSLCRSTVESHNGQIWGENTGSGARFGFTLPIGTDEVAADG